jgi:hypothetical protein
MINSLSHISECLHAGIAFAAYRTPGLLVASSALLGMVAYSVYRQAREAFSLPTRRLEASIMGAAGAFAAAYFCYRYQQVGREIGCDVSNILIRHMPNLRNV